ncbi:preprotein translocase subunit YajC [Povalibacter sp.]|uniref:preprotein translocase subunit YajC n=1 Tax=Povalibacter sp. TaxID=1962978 RepID=UPI002F404329
MDWLISTAQAQAQGTTGQGSALMQFLPLILIFVVFYFLLIRPQTKRAKEHREMVAALEVGAEVVTNGGILGKVTAISEQFLTIEIADGVNVKVQRHTVSQILPKGTLKSA